MCLCIPAACWSGCAPGYYYAAEHRQPVRTHCPIQVSGVLSRKCVTVVNFRGAASMRTGCLLQLFVGLGYYYAAEHRQPVRSVSGVYLECIWSVSGVYLECIWGVSGRIWNVSAVRVILRVIWRVIQRVIWGHLWTSGAQGALRAHGPFECSKHNSFTMKSDRGDHFTSTKWPQCSKTIVKHIQCKRGLYLVGNLPASR